MNIWIVCPCFFDAEAFLRVREEVVHVLADALPGARPRFVLVDDSAGQDPAITGVRFDDVQVVTPPYNLGHQGALVFALRGLGTTVSESDYVVTMDSDGEDRPGDLGALIAPLRKNAGSLFRISIAIRTRRTESLAFKLFYLGYKLVFRVLTGTVIRNGNFAAYRGWLLKEVIFHPHFDQCYSSSFISLPMQIDRVPLPRGNRYAGQSRMGYMGLITHGIRMLMPFSEKIATRGIIVSAPVVALSVVGMAVDAILGRNIALPFLTLLLGVLVLGSSTLLFATFSQNKSRSLRGLNRIGATG